MTIQFHEINGKKVEVKVHEKRTLNLGQSRGCDVFSGRGRFAQSFNPYNQQPYGNDYSYGSQSASYGSYEQQQQAQFAYVQSNTAPYSQTYGPNTVAYTQQAYAQQSAQMQNYAQQNQQYGVQQS